MMTGPDDRIDNDTNSRETDACLSSSVPVKVPQQQPHQAQEEYDRLFGADDISDEQPTTTRRELWSYYLYYNGKSTCKFQRFESLHQLTLFRYLR